MHSEVPRPDSVENVILIVVDSLRYDTADNEMPTLNGLADDHIELTQFHTAGPGTPSSMSAMMQSRQPVEHDGEGMKLPTSRPTLAEHLADSDIATAGWHCNAYLTPEYGFNRGFDHYVDVGERDGNDRERSTRWRQQMQELTEQLGVRNLAERAFKPVKRAGLVERFTQEDMETFINAGFDWLNKSEQQFAYLHPMDVHLPYYPPADYRTQSGRHLYDIWQTLTSSPADLSDGEVAIARRAYRNEARYVDAQIDQLVNNLKTSNAWDETALIITADHGELFRDRKTPKKHALKHINYCCEELVHVPCVIAGGGIPDRTIDTLTSGVDISPTVAELLDVSPADDWAGVPIWSSDVEKRKYVASSIVHTRGRGVQVNEDALHIAVRTQKRALLWWADDSLESEYLSRTPTGEITADPESKSFEQEHVFVEEVRDQADPIGGGALVGGDVTERLRDLGYVEGDS